MKIFSGKGHLGLAVLGLTLIAFLAGCGSVLQEKKKEETSRHRAAGVQKIRSPQCPLL